MMADDNTRRPEIAKPSPVITKEEYLVALAAAEQATATLDPAGIIARLKRDQDGKALAAVNQLRASHTPEDVLRATIRATGFALAMPAMRADIQQATDDARRNADSVRQIIAGAAKGYSKNLDFSLEGLANFRESHARGCEVGLAMMFLPTKMNGKNATSMVALRMLRDKLYPNKRAPHQPLQWLIKTALGKEVTSATVKEALRVENSLQALAGAKFSPPAGGDSE